MDQYCEYLVKQRTAPWRKGLNFLTVALCVLCLIGGFRITPWLLLLAVALGAGAWFLFRTTEVEYEYLLIEEEFSVDCIYQKSRRKHKATYPVLRFAMVAPSDSPRLGGVRKEGCKVQDFSSHDPQKETYSIVCKDQDVTEIRITPDDRLLSLLERMLPSGTVTR
jgi:hypothetical protein